MKCLRLCLLYLVSAILLFMQSCSEGSEDPILLDISQTVSSHPKEALARLDSIDTSSLNESDRYFHDLLCIKAKDKAFIKHNSDSVILKVIDFYSKRRGSKLYPEALYYGGRIYSDIGDYPSALHYFQDALDALGETPDLDLKSRILTQKGWILHSLRMYNEAIKDFEENIRIDTPDNDSIKYLSNMKLLGAAFLHLKDYRKADSCFIRARKTAVTSLPSDTVTFDMYLAGTQLYRDNTDSALKLIRPVLPYAIANNLNLTMAYAANIYLEAGILDSAYLYAEKLIHCNSIKHQKTGYRILLLPEMRKFVHSDSLLSYISSYREVLDESLDNNDSEQIQMQTSIFNYQLHERERKRAEASKTHYMLIALIAIVVGLFFCLATLYFRNKSIANRLQYHEALNDIERLRHALASENKPLTTPQPSDEVLETDLRERLKGELLALQKKGEAKSELPQAITESNAYSMLQNFIESNKIIYGDTGFWIDLENVVLAASPEFKSRLQLLTGGEIKDDIYHIALLIKCGATPTQLTILMGRTKGTISSKRGALCAKIFGEKLGATVMDDIIRLL